MEFINSFVAYLVDIVSIINWYLIINEWQGLLSEQDETKETFLNKLLYSEDIEVSEFD